MAIDKTEIVNRALVKLGSRPVTNIEDDETDEAITALNVYDIALESMLTETLWTFAKRRFNLAKLTDTVPFNKLDESLVYVYQRPTDVLRIFEVNDDGADWYEEEDKILSDTDNLGIVYTFRNTNPSTYKPYFVEAFADKLAADMAFPLLNSISKAKDMAMFFEEISLPRAKAENAQTGKAKEMSDDYWLIAKHGGPNVKEFQ